jgi:hypothetical protein
MPPMPIVSVFDGLTDPRREAKNELHRLTDILTIATWSTASKTGARCALPPPPMPNGRSSNARGHFLPEGR